MSMINELVDRLRTEAKSMGTYGTDYMATLLTRSADTIEMLSEKAREPKQGEWTSWEDGLPGCDEEVLVTDGTFVWIDELESDGDMYWWDCQNVEPETTAWMYLPDPYKGNE